MASDQVQSVKKAFSDKLLEIAIGMFVIGVMSLGGMYLNSQIQTLQEMVKVTQELQVEVTRQGQTVAYLVQDVVRIDANTQDRYTRTESQSERELLLSKIEANTKHIDQNKQRIRELEQRFQDIQRN